METSLILSNGLALKFCNVQLPKDLQKDDNKAQSSAEIMYPLDEERNLHVGCQFDADVKARSLSWGQLGLFKVLPDWNT